MSRSAAVSEAEVQPFFSDSMREEKPRGPRVIKRVPVQFGPSNSVAEHEGITMDVSSAGLRLVSGEIFPAGSVLKIVMNPADGPAFELKGVVVWSAQSISQMRVRLVAPDARFTDYVTRLLARTRAAARPMATLVPVPIPADRGALVRATVTLPDGGTALVEGLLVWCRLAENEQDETHVALRITNREPTP